MHTQGMTHYTLSEKTPVTSACVGGPCPAIYAVERTPHQMRCGVAACPRIYEQNKDNYLIIGTAVGLDEARMIDIGERRTLADKIGTNELLISVPKKLIDEMQR